MRGIAVCLLLVAGCGASLPAAPARRTAASHIVTIVMENKEASDVLAHAPYVGRLARRYGLATRSYGVRHPSLPNYIALTSGSTQGITDDCDDCRARGRNIVDQLAAAHVSWRGYFEDMPHACYRGGSVGGYTRHHNPFVYYDDVSGRRERCRRLVPMSRLAGDLRHGRLPTYAFVVPNKCHDMHDCSVGTGDRFLRGLVPRVLRALGPHGVLILTWDEGTTDAGCCGRAHGGRIATVVAGPDVRRGARMRAPVDHYGVLRTIEDALGLRHLGAAADRRSGSLRPLFRRAPRVR
jgi:hypothetical protein